MERYYWMDLARVLACFAVIVIHSCNKDMYSLLLSSQCHCAVPIFVMISGTNFLKRERSFSITKAWKGYIFPLLRIFFTWSLLYAVWNSYIYTDAINFEWFRNVLINTINGHYHLWYIWMTIGLYCVAPFIKKVTDNSSNRELLYYVLIAFAFLSLNFLVEFYPFNNFYSLNLDLRISFVSGFLIYYIGGCYLSRLQHSKKVSIFMLIIAILSTAFNCCLVLLQVDFKINSYFLPSAIGVSFAIYWFLSRYTEPFCKKHKQVLGFMSRLTLPIYMIHIFAIEIVKKLLNVEKYGAGFGMLIALMSFALSFVVSYLLSLNRFTKKVFVGK